MTESTPPPPTNRGRLVALRRALPWLPVASVFVAGLLPFALFLVHTRDPVFAVRVAEALTRGVVWALVALTCAAIVLALVYPPFPAWIRRGWTRTRTRWTSERAPLTRALAELEHLQTAQRHLDVARLAWIRGDRALVAEHAVRAVALDDELAPAHYLLGQHLLEEGDTERAFAAFAAAERLDPGHAFGGALLRQARAAFLLSRIDEALELFARHRDTHGGSNRADYWRGEALAAAGRIDEARAAFVDAATADHELTAEEDWFRALARVRTRGPRARTDGAGGRS